MLSTTGIITANPRFVKPNAGDYHLAWNSPAIDSGEALSVTEDLDGWRRSIGAGYDIGAYECSPFIVLPLVIKN